MSDSQNPRDVVPSRRGLIQGAAACALPLPNGILDPALVLAKRCRWLGEEQRRLSVAWQGVEAWLFEHRNWPRLTSAEQAAVPEAAQLRAIEQQLADIDTMYDRILPLLRKTPALTREGLFARLDVLLSLIDMDDNPDAHALLKSCRSDLERLWR